MSNQFWRRYIIIMHTVTEEEREKAEKLFLQFKSLAKANDISVIAHDEPVSGHRDSVLHGRTPNAKRDD